VIAARHPTGFRRGLLGAAPEAPRGSEGVTRTLADASMRRGYKEVRHPSNDADGAAA
jgi:hypothetical protein